jgi:hypothetical protein
MTRIEVELLGALFLIYAYECVHWIGPEAEAFTRASATGWKRHQRGPLSFTLLNKTPLLVDPFLILPGYIQRQAEPSPAIPECALQKVAARLNALWLLEMQCRIQAMLLLLFLPWVIWSERLTTVWPSLTVALFCSHLLLMISFLFALRRYPWKRRLSIAAPFFLNPLGSTRLLEVVSQVSFEEEIERG